MPQVIQIVPKFDVGRFAVVAIGSSTGGPGVLETIIRGLPADLPVPILIAQHMPPRFTVTFAARLDAIGALSVVHAEDGMPLHPGTVYVAEGHKHLRVRRGVGHKPVIEVNATPADLVYKPSVDELFHSCAAVFRGRTLAVVLSGIGRDGMQGAGAIRDAGGVILTQAAHTCAVYGMPRSCDDAGLSTASLTPPDLARAILQLSPQHGHEAKVA